MLKMRTYEKQKKVEKPFFHTLSLEAQLAMQEQDIDVKSSDSEDNEDYTHEIHSQGKTKRQTCKQGGVLDSIPQIKLQTSERGSSHISSSSAGKTGTGGPTCILPPLVKREMKTLPHVTMKKRAKTPETQGGTDRWNKLHPGDYCSIPVGHRGPGILDYIHPDVEDNDLLEDDMFISEIARENTAIGFGVEVLYGGEELIVNNQSNAISPDPNYFDGHDELTESQDFYTFRSKTGYYKT